MKVQVEVFIYYGNKTAKPLCDNALAFCTLLGQKTLTSKNLELIRKLGFEVEEITPSVIKPKSSN